MNMLLLNSALVVMLVLGLLMMVILILVGVEVIKDMLEYYQAIQQERIRQIIIEEMRKQK